MLPGQVADIIFGAVFLFIGLATCCIAAIRRRSGVRIFVWLGIWSAMYGASLLSRSPAVLAVTPRWFGISAPYATTAMSYLMVVAGLMTFMELSQGRLRQLIQAFAFAGVAIAMAGIGFFVSTGSYDRLMLPNNLLATCTLLILTVVVAVPKLSAKYLALPDRGALAAGTFVFATEALYVNLARPLGFEAPRLTGHLGFAILLFSFGYAALQFVFAKERRLLAIENELTIARDIQSSILPACVPEIDNLSISAAYRPMAEVAGDFYEFVPVDDKRAGILVADVSGHGVPAALIASMVKVAMQSVIACADDPRAVLSGLNRILSGQLRGQFITAAYLWIDTENGMMRYSAAGHPPLLRWRQGKLERFESNGLLFGVFRACDDYPVCSMPIQAGDRFLMYTDGVTEAENADGGFFGDLRLEEVVRENEGRAAAGLSDEVLSAVRRWQPDSVPQQDDITLVVVDVVAGRT